MRILHLVHDSPFVDGLIETFACFSVPSRFVVLTDGSVELRMVTRLCDVAVVDVKSKNYQNLLVESGQFDVVWLHYASRLKIDFVNHLPGHVKVFWSTWGGDYCQFLAKNFYSFRTFCFLTRRTQCPWKFWIRYFIKQILSCLHLDWVLWPSSCRSFFRRIDFFSCVLPSEEKYVRRLIGWRAQYCMFQVTKPTEGAPREMCFKVDIDRCKIWAGNSAIATNNHFDMYAELSKSKYADYEVYSPLSYGSEGYHNQIAEYGKRMMGERYHPILNYMPWDEYAELMSSCSIFVFWHYRQQSVGNIMMALRMGGCVFISRRSPVYEYLKGRGLIIYSLEDLKSRLDECLAEFKPLQDANRDKAMKTYNWEEMAQEMKASLEFLEQEVSSKK